jgi:hypothetical protein
MRTVVGEDVVVEVDLNMAMVTELGHILFASHEVGIGCLERNQRSRNRVLDIHMLLLQVSCTLDRELVGSTRENRSGTGCRRLHGNATHLIKSSFGNSPYLRDRRF